MAREIIIVLKGNPTVSHCSQSSSISPCNYLNSDKKQCKLFDKELQYDFNFHAYKRCETCIIREYEEQII